MSSVSKKRQQQQQEPSEQSHPPQQNLSSSSTHRSESQLSTSQRNNNNNNNNSSIARYSPPQPEDDERRAVADDRDEAPNSPPPPLPQQQQPSPANQLPSSSVSSSRPSAAAVVAPVASVDDIQLQDLDVDTPPRGGTPSSSSLPHPVPAAQQQQQQLSATPAAQTRPISSADTNTSIASTVPRGMTTDDRPLLGSGGGGEPQPSSSSSQQQQQQQTQQRTPPYGSVGTAVAHPGLAAYPYCVAIVNPASGERSAAQFVFDCLCEELGPDRVLRLDGAVFRNPAPIRLLVEKALRPDGERGTVLVSGGDGTVAFVMAQLDAIAEQYGIQASAPRSDGGRGGAEGEEESPEARQEEDERLLGMHRSPPLGAADAPPPPPPPASSTPIRLPAVGVLALGTGNDFSNCMGFGNGYTKRPCCCMCICCINRVSSIVKEIVQCPAIPFDRWVATMGPADEDVTSPVPPKTTIFMNYFSLGMDAFIATKFDGLRRAYPSCFQYRFQNKGWYGALGMYGAMKCDRLNKSVPKLSLVTAKSVLKNASSSSSSSAPSKQRHQDPNEAQNNLPASSPNNSNEGQLSTVLPPKTKALVLSNVDSYSGGTKLWADGNKGSKYCATRTPSKVSINDHLLEVQALGGLVDMTMLQMKLGNGADKIAQVKECEILVGGSMKEPVPVQADGEPMGALTSATKIVVKRYEKLVYVRCRRSEVDSTASVGLGRK